MKSMIITFSRFKISTRIIDLSSHLVKSFSKLPAWFDLLDLQNKLYQHQLINNPPTLSLLQYLADPDYYILKIIISVLDVQRLRVQLSSDPAKRRLQEAINALDKNLQYEELISACRKINRSVK